MPQVIATAAFVSAPAAIFLDKFNGKASPVKAKGVGELGICGSGAAAVANAIYHATGVRLREYPLTRDKVLGGLPRLA